MPVEIAAAIAGVKITIAGVRLISRFYKKTLVKYRIRLWQDRVSKALDDVLPLRNYLTDAEVDAVIMRTHDVLTLIAVLDATCAGNKSFLVDSELRRLKAVLDSDSSVAVAVAKSTSNLAKERMLRDRSSKVDKDGLLKRLKPKLKTKKRSIAKSLALLTDASNSYVESLISTSGSLTSEDFDTTSSSSSESVLDQDSDDLDQSELSLYETSSEASFDTAYTTEPNESEGGIDVDISSETSSGPTVVDFSTNVLVEVPQASTTEAFTSPAIRLSLNVPLADLTDLNQMQLAQAIHAIVQTSKAVMRDIRVEACSTSLST